MAMGIPAQPPPAWWTRAMLWIRFAVKLPLGILLTAASVAGAFVAVVLLFRITQWLWKSILSKPW
ncbi:MAG: hypothetical protein V1809_08875 [Planctomycetota bacterium]